MCKSYKYDTASVYIFYKCGFFPLRFSSNNGGHTLINFCWCVLRRLFCCAFKLFWKSVTCTIYHLFLSESWEDFTQNFPITLWLSNVKYSTSTSCGLTIVPGIIVQTDFYLLKYMRKLISTCFVLSSWFSGSWWALNIDLTHFFNLEAGMVLHLKKPNSSQSRMLCQIKHKQETDNKNRW